MVATGEKTSRAEMVRDIGARQAAERAQDSRVERDPKDLESSESESEEDQAQAPPHVAQYKRRRECGRRLRVPTGFSA